LAKFLAKRFILFREGGVELWRGLGVAMGKGVQMGLRPYRPLPLNLSSLFVIGLRLGVESGKLEELGRRYSWKKPGALVGVAAMYQT
jgi:hypothetical protein